MVEKLKPMGEKVMTKGNRHGLKYASYLSLALITLIVLVSSTATATVSTPDPNLTGSYTGSADLWYMTPQSYRKAGLNIENPYNEAKLVTGINMVFNLSESPGYRATVNVQRGELGEDQEAMTEHQIENFLYGEEEEQNFLFTEEDYLIVDTNYNLQLKPLRADHLKLQCIDDDSESSFYWDPNTGDWDTSDEAPNSPNIEGKAWAMNALVEQVGRLNKGMEQPNQFIPPDAVDAYMADLQIGKTYVFKLTHSAASNFQLSVFRDRNPMGVPGKVSDETKLVSTSGSDDEKKVTLTADYTGRHYIIVKPQTGSGIYNVEYIENQDPVAKAGDDVYANLKYGESVEVTFENLLSYDPDDDENKNEEIDGTEEDNLEYHWDFDLENGVPTNLEEMDAKGQKVTRSFTIGGTFEVTLTVVDTYGTRHSDTFDLYINYIPIVKLTVIGVENGEAYVDEKLTFSADGSYDPDDDTNGNGAIDGSEVDGLTYSWDFYDYVDKNMDGNYTNDKDASNKMWEMKFNKANSYVITLNIWDNHDPAHKAYNFTSVELVVTEKFDPMELFNEDMVEGDEVIHEDANTNPYSGSTEQDVAARKIKGSIGTEFLITNLESINIEKVFARGEEKILHLGMTTKGEIRLGPQENTIENFYYYFYIVKYPYAEPTVTQGNFASMYVEYLYNFTFHHGVLTGETSIEDDAIFDINYTVTGEGRELVINIPYGQLLALKREFEYDDTFQIDIFGVSVYTLTETIAAESHKTYARDATGRATSNYPVDWWAGENGDDDIDGDDAPPAEKDNCAISNEVIQSFDTDNDGFSNAVKLSFNISNLNTHESYITDAIIYWHVYNPTGNEIQADTEEIQILPEDSKFFEYQYTLNVGNPQGIYMITADISWEGKETQGESEVKRSSSILYPPGHSDQTAETDESVSNTFILIPIIISIIIFLTIVAIVVILLVRRAKKKKRRETLSLPSHQSQYPSPPQPNYGVPYTTPPQPPESLQQGPNYYKSYGPPPQQQSVMVQHASPVPPPPHQPRMAQFDRTPQQQSDWPPHQH